MSLLENLQTKVQGHHISKCEISSSDNSTELEKKPLNTSKKEQDSLITSLSGATLLGALVGGAIGAVVGGVAGYFLLRK